MRELQRESENQRYGRGDQEGAKSPISGQELVIYHYNQSRGTSAPAEQLANWLAVSFLSFVILAANWLLSDLRGKLWPKRTRLICTREQ